jgi:hypothetical protein
MTLRPLILLTLALAAPVTWADSTSSASSVASTAAGSASNSLGASSNSSSNGLGVVQGPYTVNDIAEVAGRPDLLELELHLQAQAPTGQTAAPVRLRLPRVTAEREQLAVGQTVLAQHRPYGLAFAKPTAQGTANPFFLVLNDTRHRELATHPVGG